MSAEDSVHNFEIMPDEELMQHTSQGHRIAFSTLVRRYQEPLVNFFRKMGVYNDAEDLAQETFVKIFKFRDNYRPRARFKTFLYYVARRIHVDDVRKQVRKKTGSEALADHAEIQQDASDSARDRKADAVEALHSLSEEMRTVVVMNIYQGLRYHEIAEILDVPAGTVKTRMFYAMRKLREKMTSDSRSE